MFYDSWGRILRRSGTVLRSDIRPALEDQFLVQQLDAIAVIVSEIGSAWDEMFAALVRENEILAATLEEAEDDSGRGATGKEPGSSADPLARNRELLSSLDEALWSLHDRGEELKLRAARRGLREAAVVQGELLANARERGGMATTRRL